MSRLINEHRLMAAVKFFLRDYKQDIQFAYDYLQISVHARLRVVRYNNNISDITNAQYVRHCQNDVLQAIIVIGVLKKTRYS